MKLLMFQAERFAFRPFAQTLEDGADPPREEDLSEAVVVFVHAEAEDEERAAKVLSRAAKNIKWLANKRGMRTIVLHSFTHLSESKAGADFARGVLKDLGSRLTNGGYRVSVTPFGHTCSWDLSVYGESIAKVFKSI